MYTAVESETPTPDTKDNIEDKTPAEPPPPEFPSLRARWGESWTEAEPLVINSRTAIPIRTELFEGKALLLIRPPGGTDVDPYYQTRIFQGRKRRFEVQLQGRFLKKPTGMLYIGAEVTERMQLGLVTRGLCRILLAFVRKLNNFMHYSFGDAKGEQLPHIVFPLWSNVDKLVVTPPGDTPPELGRPLEEDPQARAKRVKNPTPPSDLSLDATYSLSINSMYIDLPSWKLCNLPMMQV
jgi:hypothetical protein